MMQLDFGDTYLQIADTLGDAPQTTISVHLLRRNLCSLHIMGSLDAEWGIIVHNNDSPEEPTAYGNDPQKMWDLLKQIPGWNCVNIDLELAETLGELIKQNMSVDVRYYGDIYFSLTQPVNKSKNTVVRLMSPGDISVLDAAPGGLRPPGFGDLETLIKEGIVACAVVEGKVVTTAHTYARTKKHAEIGVETHPDYRQRGYATAASSLVVEQVQASRQIPVWSTGEDNYSSIRVAEKLGFIRVPKRMYIILEKRGK